MKKYHFIAVGGAVMHNLALALVKKGDHVTGSDDEIYEPSRTRLAKAGILPAEYGWFPEKITSALDGIILGMHARIDNPELIKAQELGIPVYSFPEFIYNQSQDKKRVVIAGSHGKTSITAIILHVLKDLNIDFDYLVGAQIEGFDLMVKLSDAPVIVIEGDEYLTSPLDRRPKFFHYHHDIVLVSGIAWDHFNVFPDFNVYKDQFLKLMNQTPPTGELIYCEVDPLVKEAAEKSSMSGRKTPYQAHPAEVMHGKTFLKTDKGLVQIGIFGDHNLQNLQGAMEVCRVLGVTKRQFYESIPKFKGAAKRQEILAENESGILFRDFAHAPSKLKATVNAVKNQFPDRRLIAVQELHTYSSLNKEFLPNYADCMKETDVAIIYLNPHAAALKKLELMDQDTLREGFKRPDLMLFTESQALKDYLLAQNYSNTNLLLMSSGNYDNLDLEPLKAKFN
ncbi:UDP-N-acetylmuramate--L-alanine ligase [Algoriphagus boritolerans]|uniref:UDP-N-acetylmuramate: L-alanyl-gamma-D-glutamyl-meso-diaminopimelate ligase n=1 Tax=Algoriphagus boritolerans DSM 17298 = JCM 18970 TaxID=1120964 RepID=A0A1H5TKQ5_9BACT|nr:Mur ligase domain-containing protein [Algoriphagus boritolerans]SEF62768.1 UDP-N-acetylmuramate: L-alanyl-gamma-D-glutamyl-meso-diaminopimelate ligase [Algoriphagus boritolerans DSM 17298 = JCM 18970]